MSWPVCRIECGTTCAELRVEPGDRVGICMRKSADAVASMFGIMKAGCCVRPGRSDCPCLAQRLYFSQLCGQSPNRRGTTGGRVTLRIQPSRLCSRNDCSRGNRSWSSAYPSSRPARRRQPGPLGAQRGSRPIATGLHSLHFGLNRSTKRRYAVARQCRLIYRLVLRRISTERT